jgi:Raf kinase inhibitor-like YbhB/YbcL family protein
MRNAAAVFTALGAMIVTGCGGSAKPTTASSSPAAQASIRVTSDFSPGAAIPRAYTCDGRDVSPPVRAIGLPTATKEVVVVMRDPDAPGGNFIHWAAAHLDAANGTLALPAAAKPPGAVFGRNDFGSVGYRGPCPPAGPAHHYVITVYALGEPSGLKEGFSAGDVSTLPILGQGMLTGTYSKAAN